MKIDNIRALMTMMHEPLDLIMNLHGVDAASELTFEYPVEASILDDKLDFVL